MQFVAVTCISSNDVDMTHYVDVHVVQVWEQERRKCNSREGDAIT